MQRKMEKRDLVNEINARTGFYKKHIRVTLAALEDIIFENMREATIDDPAELRPFFGIIIGANRIPEKEVKDPRNGNTVISEEHLNPYVRFKQTFRWKLNGQKRGVKIDKSNEI